MKIDTDYNSHWDEKFRSRNWGRYPPEELVRFVGRNYSQVERENVNVLELGCGPGANLWFLHREGFCVSGIDGSEKAIELANNRITSENKSINSSIPELFVGNFSKLPWENQSFDLVVDIFALYANTLNVIETTISEVDRVLKPGARFFTMLWGKNCTGYREGIEIESGTYDQIPSGPCQNMGISHFFDLQEIEGLFSNYSIEYIDKVTRTDELHNNFLEEYVCQFIKPE